MVYRVKVAVKVPDDPKATEKHRSAVTKLIDKHEGKNASRSRPGKYVVGVFSAKETARAFRHEARGTVQATD